MKKIIFIFSFLFALFIAVGVGFYLPHKEIAAPVSPVDPVTPIVPVTPVTCSTDPDTIFSEINNVRIKNSLSPIKRTYDLDVITGGRAFTMDGTDFEHTGFETLARNHSFPRSYRYVGENLAKGYCNAEATVNGWINSPTHKAVMLDPRYDNIGIANYKSITVTIYGDLR